MPQLYLEVTKNISDNVDFHSLIKKVHSNLFENLGAKVEDCKTRVTTIENFFVGDIDYEGFVHLRIALLAGRDKKLLKETGNQIGKLLQDSFANNKTKITLHFEEVDKELYFKLT